MNDLRRSIFDQREPIFGPEDLRDFRSERVYLGLLGLISSLKKPDLGLRGLERGGVQTDGWTNGPRDERKFIFNR